MLAHNMMMGSGEFIDIGVFVQPSSGVLSSYDTDGNLIITKSLGGDFFISESPRLQEAKLYGLKGVTGFSPTKIVSYDKNLNENIIKDNGLTYLRNLLAVSGIGNYMLYIQYDTSISAYRLYKSKADDGSLINSFVYSEYTETGISINDNMAIKFWSRSSDGENNRADIKSAITLAAIGEYSGGANAYPIGFNEGKLIFISIPNLYKTSPSTIEFSISYVGSAIAYCLSEDKVYLLIEYNNALQINEYSINDLSFIKTISLGSNVAGSYAIGSGRICFNNGYIYVLFNLYNSTNNTYNAKYMRILETNGAVEINKTLLTQTGGISLCLTNTYA